MNFENSYNKKMDGSIAERMVLGFQDNKGFLNQIEKDEKFEEELNNLTEEFLRDGIVDEIFEAKVISGINSDEEKKEKIKPLIRDRFINIPFVKKAEKESALERKISAKIKNIFSIKKAVIQTQRIADYNRSVNEDVYLENITTPFTLRLLSSLTNRLKKNGVDPVIIYNPAIFKDDNIKTHLDGIRGTDAYVLVNVGDGFRFFYLDYTGDPKKAPDSVARGYGIEKQTSGELGKKDSKFVLYVDFNNLEDDQLLARLGDSLAKEIEDNIG